MLSPEAVSQVRALVAKVAAADGARPLNEDALLALGSDHPTVEHLLRHDNDELIGYAQHNHRHGSGQLLVHPAHRRRGVGSDLLAALAGAPVWAFGDLGPAQHFAAANHLIERRRLLIMERPLDPSTALTDPSIRPFDAATDADQLLDLNALAFDWHPEQRHFSRADLNARMAESWYDPNGFLVATDAAGLVGFHWTKRHPDGRGEVYILATAPRAQGTGVGRRLLAAGLDHLAEAGCPTVHLYVEAANTRAVELYERAGFAVVHSDVLYGLPDTEGQEHR